MVLSRDCLWSERSRADYVNWPFASEQSRGETELTFMREQILRQFFEDKSSATELARDVFGSTRQSTPTVSITSVEDMDEDFRVTAEMGVRLCDAVLAGDLPAESLRTIGFALEASDRFHWDGDEDRSACFCDRRLVVPRNQLPTNHRQCGAVSSVADAN